MEAPYSLKACTAVEQQDVMKTIPYWKPLLEMN